jgi:hypothetical protein
MTQENGRIKHERKKNLRAPFDLPSAPPGRGPTYFDGRVTGAARRQNPEHHDLNLHHHENLIYIAFGLL